MSLSRFNAEAVKEKAFGDIGASYTQVGAAYAYPISKIYVANLTDVTLYFSFDGATNHFVLPTSGFIMLDVTMDPNTPDYLPTGGALFVKRLGTPSSGSVYVSTFYGTNR